MDFEEIVARLTKTFGSGDGKQRRIFYETVAATIVHHGERAERVMKDLAIAARQKKKPDRYFCHVALTRLKENGFNIVRVDDGVEKDGFDG